MDLPEVARFGPLPSPPFQVRASTSCGGLSYWHPEISGHAWGEWDCWPHLVLVNDQGSDDKSAVFGLLHHPPVKLNAMAMWGFSHGSWRDVLRMVKSCGHYSLLLLCLVTVNLNHGPDSTDLRFWQLRESMQHHLSVSSPSSSPLFQALSSRMLEEAKHEVDLDSVGDPLAALWSFVGKTSFQDKKGYKANLNRFHSVVAELRTLLQKSARLLFQYQHFCIDAGFLNNRIAAYQLKVQLRGKDPSSSETTARTAIGLDDKALRSTGANAVVIAMLLLLLLSSPGKLRLVHMLTEVGMCVMEWHAYANRECRDVFRSKLWLLDQVTNGFGKHLFEISQVLLDNDILVMTGFVAISMEATKGL